MTVWMLTLIASVATVSGLAASLLPTIQIGKMWRARTSAGISLPYLSGGLANNVVWVVYSAATWNVPLVCSTSVGLVMNVTMLTTAVRLRPRATGDLLLRSDTELARAA
jgi:uncharacterized protein with PQ loop repeat